MKAIVLMYHRIAPGRNEDRYTVSTKDFSRQMKYLAARGYRVLELSALVHALNGGPSLPERSVVVTFDDGFLDTYANATPVLTDLGFSATHFVVTGLAGGQNAWMAEDGYPASRLMGWPEIAELKRCGFEVGSHTASHPDLLKVAPLVAKAEVQNSRKTLEDRLGGAVRYFAYPYGHFDQPVRDLVAEAGYEAACSTLSGFVNGESDRFSLRRIEVFGDDSLRTFGRKLEFGANEMSLADVAAYYVKRFVAAKLERRST